MGFKRARTDSGAACIEFAAHRREMMMGLDHLRADHLLLDVTLVAEGCEQSAHKAVLAACSDFFRAMFTTRLSGGGGGDTAKIHLNGVTANGLRMLVDFAYTSQLSLSADNVDDVLAAADFLQMPRITSACAKYLRAQLRLSRALATLNVAERYSLPLLQQHVYQFLCNSLTAFVDTEHFVLLSVGQLCRMLDGSFPVDCSEEVVLRMVIRWIAHDKVNRIVYAKQLFEAVNYESIAAESLAALALANGLFRQVADQLPVAGRRRCVDAYADDESVPSNRRGLERCMVTIGGFYAGEITNKIMFYDAAAAADDGDDGGWKLLTAIPHVEQCNYGVAVLRNKLYVVGGCFNQSLQENIHPFGFAYDPRADRWTTISPMTQERCRFYLGMVGSKMYAIGGAEEATNAALEESSSSSTCECYDPDADRWSPIRPLPSRRVQHGGATWRNLLFVCGGLEEDCVTDSLLCYDTSTDVWEEKAAMLRPRADHCVILYESRLVVAGGWYEDELTGTRVIANTLDCYDIETDTWTVVSRVPTPRYHGTMLQHEHKIYITGGFTEQRRPTRKIECYDPEKDAWTVEGEYPDDIWEHSSSTLYVPCCTTKH
ncbi:PREDICTED: kelch-like protein 13 [Priapulus caudatus]|uniref:Kelch-like protein 13 n=1 Tax=Priapulus caudatus TaxID=37621 RepID=A0ABM1DNB2_PRICU|nr:PREDICTED: kelch-like protein 13 [Priapulus caudatus]